MEVLSDIEPPLIQEGFEILSVASVFLKDGMQKNQISGRRPNSLAHFAQDENTFGNYVTFNSAAGRFWDFVNSIICRLLLLR